MDIIERLLNMCRDIRRKPIPVSGVIPLMQEASAELARLRAENERLRGDNARLAVDADRFRWLARADGCPFAETDDVWFVWNELAKQIDAAMAQGKV